MTISVWEERYRPSKVEELILPDRIKTFFQSQVDAGEIQNMLLEGPPGCGKTSAAIAMADQLGCDWIKINGSDETGIDVLRGKVRTFASTSSIMNDAIHKVVVIFDEADYLNPNSTQPALRGFLDEFQATCRFIFTCNYKNRIISPLHSRLTAVSFVFTGEESARMAGQFMKRSMGILEDNKIEYDKEALAAIIRKVFPDFRKILGDLQRYSKAGKIDLGILNFVGDAKVESLCGFMKAKDFSSIRKFFTENPDISPAEFFESLYRVLCSKLVPQTIPSAVLILAEYQHKSAFAVNPEINLTACCVQIMIDCQFK